MKKVFLYFFIALLTLVFIVSCKKNISENSKFLVKKERKGKSNIEWGYINDKGTIVVPFDKYLICLTDTIDCIGFVINKSKRCIVIDNNGKELFYAFLFDNGPDPLSCGLFRIESKNRRQLGYSNEFGKIVISARYDYASSFEDSLARVMFNDTIEGEVVSKWGVINTKGISVIPIEFDSLSLFYTSIEGKVLSVDTYKRGEKVNTSLERAPR